MNDETVEGIYQNSIFLKVWSLENIRKLQNKFQEMDIQYYEIDDIEQKFNLNLAPFQDDEIIVKLWKIVKTIKRNW